MNQKEAVDIHDVLCFLLGIKTPWEPLMSNEKAKAAAVRLASQTRALLKSGIDAEDVAAAWPRPRRPANPSKGTQTQ